MNLLYKSNYKVIILLKYDRVQYFQQFTNITITPTYYRFFVQTVLFLCNILSYGQMSLNFNLEVYKINVQE